MLTETATPQVIEDYALQNLGEVPVVFDKRRVADEVRRLSQVSAWRAVVAIAFQYVVIGIAAASAIWTGHWAAYVIAVVVIAGRQHALGALVHDGAHYRLFRRRWLNDLVCDAFCAYPLLISLSLYRASHFAHHRWVNTDRDPDVIAARGLERWKWPKTRAAAMRTLAMNLLGLSWRTHKFMLRWNPWVALVTGPWDRCQTRLSRGETVRLITWGVLVAVAIVMVGWGGWYLLVLWILPQLTVLAFALHLRNVAEHTGVKSSHELDSTRHIAAPWWERWLVSPLNSNYHLAHHMFPSVPWYRLPELQRLLDRDADFAAHAAKVSRYLGFAPGDGSAVGELIGAVGSGGAVQRE